MYVKALHRTLGILLATFIVTHLAVHLTAILGPDVHSMALNFARNGYRHPVLETLLVLTIVVQITAGVSRLRFRGTDGWARAQVISGLYLMLFLTMHTSAAVYAHNVIGVDTDFYWAAGSLYFSPIKFGFALYYFFAVVAVFTHLAAALHFSWANAPRALLNGLPPVGAVLGFLLIMIFSGAFYGIEIPPDVTEYFRSYFQLFKLEP